MPTDAGEAPENALSVLRDLAQLVREEGAGSCAGACAGRGQSGCPGRRREGEGTGCLWHLPRKEPSVAGEPGRFVKKGANGPPSPATVPSGTARRRCRHMAGTAGTWAELWVRAPCGTQLSSHTSASVWDSGVSLALQERGPASPGGAARHCQQARRRHRRLCACSGRGKTFLQKDADSTSPSREILAVWSTLSCLRSPLGPAPQTQGPCSAPLAPGSEPTGTQPRSPAVVGGSRLERHSHLHAVLRADAGLQADGPTRGLRHGLSSCDEAPPGAGDSASHRPSVTTSANEKSKICTLN